MRIYLNFSSKTFENFLLQKLKLRSWAEQSAREPMRSQHCTAHMTILRRCGFFIFLFFIFVFYKNIFRIWKFTEIYLGCPAAGRPGPGRPAGAYSQKK